MIDIVRRDEQTYQRLGKQIHRPQEHHRHAEAESGTLPHNRADSVKVPFPVAPRDENLRTDTKAESHRIKTDIQQPAHSRSTQSHFAHVP